MVGSASHWSILWVRCHASGAIRPALLGKTPRRDIRNQRLRKHVMMTVRCDLSLESSSHADDASIGQDHGRCGCTCTYEQLKQEKLQECAQSITSVMTVLAQPIPQSLDVLSSKCCAPCTANQATLKITVSRLWPYPSIHTT